MRKPKVINLKGDLFATAWTFAASAVLKLGSSLALTRLLRPDAYGIIAILMSINVILTMIADIGTTVSIVRSKEGDDPRFLNTAWTLKFLRSLINGSIVLVGAPVIASLYHAPEMTTPIRVFSIWFFIDGFESISFPLAVRST